MSCYFYLVLLPFGPEFDKCIIISLYCMYSYVNESDCLMCLSFVWRVCNIVWGGCCLVVECYGSVECGVNARLDIPYMVLQGVCVLCM